MSEEQNPTATLTYARDPSAQDVELLNRIVLRAQHQPLTTERDSLITAYDAVIKEQGLDASQDEACFWVLLEMLKPGAEGNTLYEKFEYVMRNKGIEVFFDDDASIQESASSVSRNGLASEQRSVASRPPSTISHQSSQDIADAQVVPHDQHVVELNLDDYLNNPPPHIAQLEKMAIAYDAQTLIRASLTQCREYLQLYNPRGGRQVADDFYEHRLKFKVLSHWQNVEREIRASRVVADDLWTDFQARRSRHQIARTVEHWHDEARVNRVQAMDEDRLRGVGLYRLTMASREATLERRLALGLKQRHLLAMTNALRSMTAQRNMLELHQQHNQARLNLIAMRQPMSTMVLAARRMQDLKVFATTHYETNLKKTVIETWYGKARTTFEAKATAENARDWFLMRKYFAKLRDAAQARKFRRMVLSKRYFAHWRRFTKNQKFKKLDENYKVIRRRFKVNWCRQSLQKMARACQEIRQMQTVADAHQAAKCNEFAHRIVVAWYTQAHHFKGQKQDAVEHADRLAVRHAMRDMTAKKQHINQQKQIADGLYDAHMQTVSADCVKAISTRVFEILRRRQDADALRGRYDRRKVRSHLIQWRQKVAANRGEGPLILPPATPAQRRADQLNRLASTTPLTAPTNSFAARLRGEVRPVDEMEDDDDVDK